MKNSILFLCMILFLTIGRITVKGEEPSGKAIRIMSYNIHNGIGMDGKTDYARIAHVISRCHPDVVAVQEADSATRRSNRKVVLDELATYTGMHSTFSAAIPYEGGKYGIGILSKEKPLRFYSLPLPGREEARTLLVAEFQDYLFACTHLSLTEEDRLASVQILKQEAEKSEKPFFLAGDWNSTPDESFTRKLLSSFSLLSDTTRPTCPSDSPEATIDYIAVAQKDTARIAGITRRVIDEPVASDHLPVICEIIFKCH